MTIVTDLRSVWLGSPALDAAVGFYAGPWGLEPVGDPDADGARSLRATGPHPSVLRLTEGPCELLGITLVVDGPGGLGQAVERLGAVGRACVESDRTVVTHDPSGLRVELVAGGAVAPLAPEVGRPSRIAHVGLNRRDVEAALAFYVGVLGFRVTDEYEGHQTLFLACGPDHHRIVLAQADHDGLQHVAYEVDGVDGVMTGWGRLRAAGHETIWGPGRHGPGGNAFCYFEDPSGAVVELSTRPFLVDEAWTPQVWERTPTNANVWGTGGPSPRAIALMTGRAPG